MKKIFFLLVVFVFLIPFPSPWWSGMYNKVTGLYICETESACIHEIAHKLDDEAGWISHSDEFYQTVLLYLPNAKKGFLNKNMEELYAGIFERAQGDLEAMPEPFRHFYDFDRAHELMKELR